MKPMDRYLLAALLLAACLPVAAQSTARPRPPGTVPLEEQPAPPPPPMPATIPEDDPRLKPVVTEREEGDKHVQEYRIGGRLYMQRVTPKNGRPYVLMDNRGDGTFTKFDNPLDPGIRVPQWVILEF
jgi:hypothetical protein